ncbi:MAG: sodium/proline symporter [Alphaproteobacteria bacterium]|nr:sodium/proline symporter [Alphaproteobacteria bacterium]
MASSLWRKNTIEDYFLASRNIPAWLVALSFGATISSGATFIGFAGLAYKSGLLAVVSVAALTIGDYVGWRIAGDKIRSKAQERKAHTYPSLIGKLGPKDHPYVTLIAAILTIIFLGTYCSAQLVTGGKIGQALFGWNFNYFVVIGALVLLAYCWSGGIRASIWTDAVQSLMILISLIVLIVAGLQEIGGFGTMWQTLTTLDQNLTDPFQFIFIPVFIGWFAFGVAILGQPQLMVRHMVARNERDIITARRIYFLWRWIVLMLACTSGMIARVMIPSGENFDPELSIPALWEDLLSPVFVGFLLAGLFSATMSTADSLLLSASSALTQHIIPKWRDSYMLARFGTVFVIIVTISIAMVADRGVLKLVIVAWNCLGSALVPLILVQLFGQIISQKTALTMMLAGLTTALFWRYGLGWSKELMDIIPGMAVGFIIFGASKIAKKRTHVPAE